MYGLGKLATQVGHLFLILYPAQTQLLLHSVHPNSIHTDQQKAGGELGVLYSLFYDSCQASTVTELYLMLFQYREFDSRFLGIREKISEAPCLGFMA